MALESHNKRHSDASKHLVDLQTPMDRRGHTDGAKHLMDQTYGGIDPPKEDIHENASATLEDLVGQGMNPDRCGPFVLNIHSHLSCVCDLKNVCCARMCIRLAIWWFKLDSRC